MLYLYTQGYMENSHLYRRSPRQESLHILVHERTHTVSRTCPPLIVKNSRLIVPSFCLLKRYQQLIQGPPKVTFSFWQSLAGRSAQHIHDQQMWKPGRVPRAGEGGPQSLPQELCEKLLDSYHTHTWVSDIALNSFLDSQ